MSILSSIFRKKAEPKKISIRGPLESVDGKMVLLIPLEAGGRDLAPFTKGIGGVSDGYLKIEIRPWLAEKLDVHVGSLVDVDNIEGKFQITRTGEEWPNKPPEPTPGQCPPSNQSLPPGAAHL